MPNKPFGGGSAESVLNPIALAIVVIAILLMWLVPRRYMLVPFLVTVILIPMEQQVVVAGLHFMVVRILLLFAWIRVAVHLIRGEKLLDRGLTALDKVFMWWVISSVATYTILWHDVGALILKLGFLYNALGIYFLLRHVVRGGEDVNRLIRTLAVICAVLAVLMSIEQLTGHNLLSLFGAPAAAEVRQGRIRSQASFLHSIIAGTCGALMVPVFVGLWWGSIKSRWYAVLGIISGTVMTITSASSTPVAAYCAGGLAMCMWPVRNRMRVIRWATVALLVGLHLVMKAPVWALIGRVDLAGGSTGWQRFALMDNFIHRFGEWWLIGTKSFATWGFDMWDAVNWYVSCGESGGLVSLVLFVAVLVYAFKSLGQFLRARRPRTMKLMVWCLGASLFACCVSFIGIVFFDQSIVFWYALLASIVATTSASTARAAAVESVGALHSFDNPPLGLGALEPKAAADLRRGILTP